METPALPKYRELSSEQLRFLDDHFGAPEDPLLLHKAPHDPLAVVRKQCSDLDSDLLRLQSRLAKCCVSWISRSFAAKSAAHSLALSLQNLSLITSPSSCLSNTGLDFWACFFFCWFMGVLLIDGIGSKRFHGVLGRELPQLAHEVVRIDEIRSYLGELRFPISCNLNLCFFLAFSYLDLFVWRAILYGYLINFQKAITIILCWLGIFDVLGASFGWF